MLNIILRDMEEIIRNVNRDSDEVPSVQCCHHTSNVTNSKVIHRI